MITNQQAQSNQQDNSEYIMPSIIELRLDTSRLLLEMHEHLSGKKKIIVINDRGLPEDTIKIFGQPKANDLGIQEIMSEFASIINPANVQGNFTLHQYNAYVKDSHRRIAKQLVINSERWAIATEDIPSIMSLFIQLVRAFMTRPIDNKEREGLTKNISHVENSSMNQRGGGVPFLKNE